jgi:inner membrane protein
MESRMDPLCHTLVGATLAQSGLKRTTPLAAATLVIGANLPDVDAITYFAGDSLYWRRGWTHGVLALAIWPFVLAATMLAWDRLGRKWRPTGGAPPARASTLAWIAALAILTHPTLDFLNSYGMRWLMPFRNRWFYGDALFIADPLVWLTLAAGALASWWLSRGADAPRWWPRPARAALALTAVYALVMLALGQAGPAVVRAQFEARGVSLVGEPMVAALWASPTRRYVVGDDGRDYHVAGFRWWPSPRLEEGTHRIPKGAGHPAVARAAVAPEGRGFLTWSRFPFFEVIEAGDGHLVTLDDARYAPAGGHSWAARQVRVPKSAAGAAAAAPSRLLPAASPKPANADTAWLVRTASALARICLPG